MPNWCDNYVVIKSEDKGYLQMLYNSLRKDDPEFLPVLRPVPVGKKTWCNWDGSGDVTKKLDGEYDWDWCITHWGTKWDIDVNNASYDGNELHISFSSAWSPPVEALQYAAEKHRFTFEHSYYEGGMMFVGYATEDADDCYSYTYDKHPSEEVPEFLLDEFPWIQHDYEEWLEEKELEDAETKKIFG